MRTDRATGANTRTIVDAKMSLSLWLRSGRAQKGLSLEAVAKITKIQPRILERLEAGKLEGLPAEVFVRGFVRSYARCVGLDEAEALERYALAASATPASGAGAGLGTASARALVDSMSELAPMTARSPKVLRREPDDVEQMASGSLPELPAAQTIETVVEVFLPETGTLLPDPIPLAGPVDETVPAVQAAVIEAEVAAVEAVQLGAEAVAIAAAIEPAKKSKKRRGNKRRNKKAMAEGTPSQPMPVVVAEPAATAEQPVVEAVVVEQPAKIEAADASTAAGSEPAVTDTTETTTDADADVEMGEPWSPKMPTVVTPTVPWRRPAGAMTSTAPAALIPTLVIDDADPDSAEREQEDRITAKEPARRSFLPPILLDREDRSARQGGLTLAVIILLIAATLTLSYLMRRPSSTGDGVTERETVHDVLG